MSAKAEKLVTTLTFYMGNPKKMASGRSVDPPSVQLRRFLLKSTLKPIFTVFYNDEVILRETFFKKGAGVFFGLFK
jgi:hypothetical protein